MSAPHGADGALLPLQRQAFDHDGDIAAQPHPNCYWLAHGLFLAGEYPRTPDEASSKARLAALLDAGVRRFLDLTEERDGLEPYAPMLAGIATGRGIRVDYQRHPIRDAGIPSPDGMRAILQALRTPAAGVTYIHCWGGIGRTGTVAGCLLVEAGFSAEEALGQIARKWASVAKYPWRRQSPETGEQCQFIRDWQPARS